MIAAAVMLAAAAADPVVGTWEGTSLCQVKPSPCHDEHVVYRIRLTATQRYAVDAYKIVKGEEQFMGSLEMRIDSSGHELVGSNRDRSGVEHPWIFEIRGNHMSGRALTAPGGALFRLVEVTKR